MIYAHIYLLIWSLIIGITYLFKRVTFKGTWINVLTYLLILNIMNYQSSSILTMLFFGINCLLVFISVIMILLKTNIHIELPFILYVTYILLLYLNLWKQITFFHFFFFPSFYSELFLMLYFFINIFFVKSIFLCLKTFCLHS